MAVGSRGGIGRGGAHAKKQTCACLLAAAKSRETYNGLIPALHTYLNRIAGMSVCLMLSVT
jgi:hypothetical protein